MKSAVWICVLDTLVAILAAFAIIPAVFVTMGAEGLGMGGGFAFMALPMCLLPFPEVLSSGCLLHSLVSGSIDKCHQYTGEHHCLYE